MKNIGIVVTPGCWAMSLFAVTDFFRIVSLLEKQTGLAAAYRVHLQAVFRLNFHTGVPAILLC